MSIFDLFRKAWQDSASQDAPAGAAPDAPARPAATESPAEPATSPVDDLQARVRKEAAELAAKQALAAAKAAVAAAGDELLDDLESELARGREARADRKPVGPDGAVADEIARRVQAAAEHSEGVRTRRADREQRAREELARLKAEMDAARRAAEARGPAIPEPPDPRPPESDDPDAP